MSEEVKKQVKVRLEREQTEGISNAATRIYAKNGVKKGKEAKKLVTIPTIDSAQMIEEMFDSTRPGNLNPATSQSLGK